MKHCNTCDTSKEIEEFAKNRTTKDGYTSQCKNCRNKYAKEYKNRNRQKYLELKKEESCRYYNKYKDNKLFNLKRRLRNRIYHYIRKNNNSKRTKELLGCEYDEFYTYIESLFTEGMSWDKLGEIHIDHIIPLSSAETEEELIKLCHYTNLQPLWAKDNLSKYNKIL